MIKVRILFILTLSMFSASCASTPVAPDPFAFESHPSPGVLLSFPMDRGVGLGNPIFLPVKIGQRQTFFMLDTGCAVTTIDSAIESVGPTVGGDMVITPSQIVRVKTVHAPQMMLGDQPLEFDKPIIAEDLKEFREHYGVPAAGILGMDYLHKFILCCDFKNRRVLLMEPTAKVADAGEWFPLSVVHGSPTMRAHFATTSGSSPDALFTVDTGCIGDGIATKTLVDSVAPNAPVASGGALELTGWASSSLRDIQADWLLAGTHYDRVMFSSGNVNAIGLSILSNYIATFDFPNRRLSLVSIRANRLPPLTSAGFEIVKRDGKAMINHVSANASAIGLCAGDEILKVNSRPVSNMLPWEIVRFIADRDEFEIYVKRDGRTHDFILCKDFGSKPFVVHADSRVESFSGQ